jgi:putative chitinase
VAISIDAYFTDSKTGDDRRQKYATDFNLTILENAKKLLEPVNALLADLGIISCTINSGWRPPSVNVAVGGSKNSAHCTGEAIDLTDKTGSLKKEIMEKLELLEKHDLYMEDSSATPTWCHLQTRKTKSGRRVFKP